MTSNGTGQTSKLYDRLYDGADGEIFYGPRAMSRKIASTQESLCRPILIPSSNHVWFHKDLVVFWPRVNVTSPQSLNHNLSTNNIIIIIILFHSVHGYSQISRQGSACQDRLRPNIGCDFLSLWRFGPCKQDLAQTRSPGVPDLSMESGHLGSCESLRP